MSEEEMLDIAEKIANFGWSDYDDFEINKKAIQGLLDLYNKEKEKNKELKEGLKYRINYCKLLEKELYTNGVNYKFEETEIEKQFLEE